MSDEQQAITDIDSYIASCPPEHRARLEDIRAVIRRYAPAATERISWGMPTFYRNGNLIHFAIAKKHIGIYPGAEAIEAFRERFDREDIKYSKGALQLPHDRDLPVDLIRDIVLYNINR